MAKFAVPNSGFAKKCGVKSGVVNPLYKPKSVRNPAGSAFLGSNIFMGPLFPPLPPLSLSLSLSLKGKKRRFRHKGPPQAKI